VDTENSRKTICNTRAVVLNGSGFSSIASRPSYTFSRLSDATIARSVSKARCADNARRLTRLARAHQQRLAAVSGGVGIQAVIEKEAQRRG
jgi:hypothetical protein